MIWVALIIWLILPLALIPAVIVLSIKKTNLQKELEILKNGGIIPELPEEHDSISGKLRSMFNMGVLLAAGAAMVVLAGIIFVTTNWTTMTGMVKIVSALVISLFFFAASLVSEKKLGLKKTGFAFFVLGGLFLPVAVIGTGFFEPFGKWFSFDGKGSYLIWLVMLLCTLAVMLAGDRIYSRSAFIKYLFGAIAAAEYVMFAFFLASDVRKIYVDSVAVSLIITAAFILSLILPYFRNVSVQTVLKAGLMLAVFEGKEMSVFAAGCLLVCVLITVASGEKIHSAVCSVAYPLAVITLIAAICDRIDTDDYTARIACIIALALSALALHFPFAAENEKCRWLCRASDAAVFILSLTFIDDSYHHPKMWLAVSVSVLFWFIVSALIYQKTTDKRICLSIAALLFTVIAGNDDAGFLDIAYDIETEYFVLVSFIFTLALRAIWKNKKGVTENLLFIHSVVAVCILMVNAADTGEMLNAVILAVICALLLAGSVIKKAKKWFVFSIVSLTAVVLYLTADLWESLGWWIYLLAAGIVFIVFAAVNEYCRITGKTFSLKRFFQNRF